MNLVQAKQFIEFDQSPIKENVPKQLTSRYKMCLGVFKRARELSHIEKISLLKALQSKIALNDEHDPLIKKVRSAIANLQADWQRNENRVACATQHYRALLEKEHGPIVDYAILDSLPELPGSEEGISENLVTQFFLIELEHFNRSAPSIEGSHLMQAIKNFFELNIYIYDEQSDHQNRLPYPMRSFKRKILHLLHQMPEGRLPYFFLPCCSDEHAMVGKVEWVDQKGFRFILINTGGGVRVRRGNQALDTVYSGLTQKEVMKVAKAMLVESATPREVYAKIAQALPLKKTSHFNGRAHGLQKRASCAVKSLTASMHSALPEGIYWRFKVSYTERLMSQMTKDDKYAAACQILAKRTQKMLQYGERQ